MAISIHCPHCQRHTALSVAPVVFQRGYATEQVAAKWEKNRTETWWIGICNNCDSAVLVLNHGERLYPYPFPSPTDSRIPEPMYHDLSEAKLCFSIKAYRACAVMARRAMQNACLNKGAKKRDLVDQINELKDNGTITNDLKEWANVVRWIGNDAAHPNKGVVSKEDAEDILSLSEQFLQVLYVAPAIAQSRKTLRGR